MKNENKSGRVVPVFRCKIIIAGGKKALARSEHFETLAKYFYKFEKEPHVVDGLEISLDGTNFYTMEEVREALELLIKKNEKCKHLNKSISLCYGEHVMTCDYCGEEVR
jgi:hypothetical protein